MIYRIGWPLWKLAAKLGCTLSYRYDIYKNNDPEDTYYYAHSVDIKGLFASGKTVEEVQEAMENGAKTLVNLDLYGDSEKEESLMLKGTCILEKMEKLA